MRRWTGRLEGSIPTDVNDVLAAAAASCVHQISLWRSVQSNGTTRLQPHCDRMESWIDEGVKGVFDLQWNELVCFPVLRYTKMKTATNIYIFNLALADSLFLATLPFQVGRYRDYSQTRTPSLIMSQNLDAVTEVELHYYYHSVWSVHQGFVPVIMSYFTKLNGMHSISHSGRGYPCCGRTGH